MNIVSFSRTFWRGSAFTILPIILVLLNRSPVGPYFLLSSRRTPINPAYLEERFDTPISAAFTCEGGVFSGTISNVSAVCARNMMVVPNICLLYTSDAADEEDSVDLGGRRIIKKKKKKKKNRKKP